jgi:hypothetical protein
MKFVRSSAIPAKKFNLMGGPGSVGKTTAQRAGSHGFESR